MRLSRKPRRTVVGLLSISTQASAVALSDFTPKDTNLPAQCNTVYIQPIPGCTFDDFQKAVCSKACLAGLVQVNALVANNCQAADVLETSIVGLFKLGKAIQLLCNVAVVTTTTGLPATASTTISMMPMPMPTLQSTLRTSTTPLSTTKATTTSAATPSTASAASTSTTSSATPSPSAKQSTTLSTTQPASTPSTSSIITTTPPPPSAATSQAKSTSASKTSTSPAELESIRSGNTHSGGGSPFDNINNSGAASMRNIAQLGCGLLASLVLGSYLTLA